eukprot:NODE_9613_length_334_cov_216.860215.p2 GENE.NODE_9613_length_334_cov_216.860215~~NODE_9613_length_334_cov_216.860215.p2  ORF type:complete len:50 (-),score=0.36 NODE_9613_length_334_cov_216.860215:85-234(-)
MMPCAGRPRQSAQCWRTAHKLSYSRLGEAVNHPCRCHNFLHVKPRVSCR